MNCAMAAPQGPFILSLVSEKNENLMPINLEMIGKKTETPDGRVVLDNFAVQLADQPLP
jgi:hypothetical protein